MIAWDRVEELREEVGEEDFAEVVELFLEEVETVLVRLSEQPSRAAMESDLHFVKGSALNLGFKRLSDHCLDYERAARAEDYEEIDIPELLAIYRSSKSAFLTRL